MKWQEHQAILVAHEDKAHAHVHVVLNIVHPETGLQLNDDFERRRAQAWALEYERENGRIYCELLDDQRDILVSLSWRQEAGFENSLFLKQVADRDAYKNSPVAFREAAEEVTGRREGKEWNAPPAHEADRLPRDGSGMKSGINIGAGIGESVGFGLISLLEGFADGVMGARPEPRRKPPDRDTSNADSFWAAAAEARKQQQQHDKENADRNDWYRKQRSLSGE